MYRNARAGQHLEGTTAFAASAFGFPFVFNFIPSSGSSSASLVSVCMASISSGCQRLGLRSARIHRYTFNVQLKTTGTTESSIQAFVVCFFFTRTCCQGLTTHGSVGEGHLQYSTKTKAGAPQLFRTARLEAMLILAHEAEHCPQRNNGVSWSCLQERVLFCFFGIGKVLLACPAMYRCLEKEKKKEMTAAALFCGGSVRIATNDKEQDVPPPRPPEGANFCESK